MQAQVIETPVTAALVRFNFHGDPLDVIRDGDMLWVSVRRVCEGLGIQPHGQAERLKGKPWAVTHLVCATGPDGKNYENFCISHRSLPMWLATIEVSRVKPAARKKLAFYQKECAEVLARMFFGEQQPGVTPAQLVVVLDELRAMRSEGAALRAANDALAAKVLQLGTQLLQSSGTITGVQMDLIRSQVSELAYMRCALAKNPHLRSARMSVENRVNAAAQWGGRGQKRRDMPADRYPLVKACLVSHRADLEAELKQRKAARKSIGSTVRSEQQSLFGKKSDSN